MGELGVSRTKGDQRNIWWFDAYFGRFLALKGPPRAPEGSQWFPMDNLVCHEKPRWIILTVGKKNLDGLLILPIFLQRGSLIGLSAMLASHRIISYVFTHLFVFHSILLYSWKTFPWPCPSKPWNMVIDKPQPRPPVPMLILPRPSLPSPGEVIT